MRSPITLLHFAAIAVLAAFPVHAQTASEDKSCWLRDVAAPADSTVFALCEQGPVWATTDGGAKWAQRNTGAADSLRALAFLDANRGLAVGHGGIIVAT